MVWPLPTSSACLLFSYSVPWPVGFPAQAGQSSSDLSTCAYTYFYSSFALLLHSICWNPFHLLNLSSSVTFMGSACMTSQSKAASF